MNFLVFFKRCSVGNQNFISKSFEIKMYFFPNKKSTFRLKLQSLSRLKNNITQAWIMYIEMTNQKSKLTIQNIKMLLPFRNRCVGLKYF